MSSIVKGGGGEKNSYATNGLKLENLKKKKKWLCIFRCSRSRGSCVNASKLLCKEQLYQSDPFTSQDCNKVGL